MKRNWQLSIFILLAFLLVACSGGSKEDDKNLEMESTIQAQQATIIAMTNPQGAQPQPTQSSSNATIQAQQATIDALQAQPGFQATATQGAPMVEPGGAENIFQTKFDLDEGYFTLVDPKKSVIENNALFMGKFEMCADFALELDRPQGCLAICKTCGTVSDYDVRFEETYVEGLVDRYTGFALRFNDNDGNNMIDRGDYFLGFIYDYYPGHYWGLWELVPSDFPVWKLLLKGEPNLRGKSTKPVMIRIVSWHDGQRIIVFMNDVPMVRIQNEDPEKLQGIPYLKDMPDSGLIGFWVAQHDVRIKYDNFTFSNKPEEPADW